jgi:hypothetical protein
MKQSRPRAFALMALLALSLPSAAQAYCRTSACGSAGTGTLCVPSMPDDCGVPLEWRSPCIGFSMQKDASSAVSLEAATEIFTRAFATWTTANCGDGSPRLEVVDMGPVTCDKHEYNQNAGNANIIIFREKSWPAGSVGDALALTTVTYNIDTGEIYDADIELNATESSFSTSDNEVTFDLLSAATHEVGHFLALSHSADWDATMFTDYLPGSTSLRTLEDDDVAAICAVYPPDDPIPSTCDPTPRHGFSAVCATPSDATVDGGCCGVAPGAPSRNGSAALGIGLGALVLSRVRRRRRS